MRSSELRGSACFVTSNGQIINFLSAGKITVATKSFPLFISFQPVLFVAEQKNPALSRVLI